MEQDPRVSSGHCKFLRVKEKEGSNVCPLLKQEINMWFFHVLPGPDLISPTLTWGAHSNGRTGSSWLWSCPLPQHWPQPDWGSVWQGRVGHTHEEHVWAPTAKDNSLHAARETSTSRGFAFTDIPSQKQPIQRLINGCFIDTVFFCTGTWSRSTTLEPFPSTFTEKFTDTWPMCLSPNGLQNTAKPHQNISRSRPKFKYGTFYKVITIPKTLTTSAIKQRRLCCPLSPDPNLWTSAATKEWIYSCHGQKFKIQVSQVSLFQKRLFWLLQTSLKCP